MDLWLSFLAGFLGSIHCIGMCGALVLGYSALPAGTPSGSIAVPASIIRIGSHLVYNAGRVLAYAVLGVAAGMIGATVGVLKFTGTLLGIGGGTLVIVAGLFMLGIFPRGQIRPGAVRATELLPRAHRALFTGVSSRGSMERIFLLGTLTPVLPCGLLYVMIIKAAATGNSLEGALVMASFGVGIVPALLLTGFASSWISSRLRVIANRLAAVVLIVMGVSMIIRGAHVPFPMHSGDDGSPHFHAPSSQSPPNAH